MFAVIKTGGKQYSVAAGDTITVMALAGVAGDKVKFDEVLLVSRDGAATIGAPTVAGASVVGDDRRAGARPQDASPSKSAAARTPSASVAIART